MHRHMHELLDWEENIQAAGYLAAMNGLPFNPYAMDLWKEGYQIFLESRKSMPSTWMQDTSFVANAEGVPINT